MNIISFPNHIYHSRQSKSFYVGFHTAKPGHLYKNIQQII